MNTIPWDKIKLVVFDVDGTLYNQEMLRRKMLFRLLRHYVFRPWKFKEIFILYHFRKERELHAGTIGGGIETLQYEWCASATRTFPSIVRAVTDKWLQVEPLALLKQCRFKGVEVLFKALHQYNIKLAVYSDFPASQKLKALDLMVDLVACSTQPEIDALKPAPNGLEYLMQNFGVNANECLFIGDREDLDAVCASNAGVHMLLIQKSDPSFFQNLLTALSETRTQ